MATAWFVLLGFMLTVYVVLDGFDLGVGALHLFIARGGERSTAIEAIGPLWDGNEVWLIAAGGLFVFAFPRAYATAFSGFYLPLMLVLWLLVVRGISIEMRAHHENVLWRQFFDVLFALSSSLVAIVLGVSLGNVIRGVPIDATGFFEGTLFTSFSPYSTELGALDWYTVSVGLFALAALAGHGAMFLRWKTEGDVNARSTRIARPTWIVVTIIAIVVTIETAFVRPELFSRFASRPLLWLLPVIAIASLVGVFVALARGRELAGFIASSITIASFLALTGGALYPLVLPSTIDPRYSLDVANAANDDTGLAIGLVWWIPAIALAIGYFGYLFRSFRGKVVAGSHYRE